MIQHNDYTSLAEIILEAHRRLAPEVWDFIVGGAEAEVTVRRNRQALDTLAVVPDVLCDVSYIDVRSSLLGHATSMPVVLSPMGSIALFEPEAALAAGRAAQDFGLLGFLSGVADPGPDEVRKHIKSPLIYTLYVSGDRHWLDDTLDHIKALGFDGIAVLADNAYYGRRDRDLMNRFKSKVVRTRSYADIQREARQGQAPELLDPAMHAGKLTWDTVEHIKQRTQLPLVIKGITTAKAAKQAVAHGAGAVYVSNTGGRQLDQQRGSASVLPEVVEAVDGQAEIIMDGGCMRGLDIVKALALGADAVGIGRLQALALAAGGSDMLLGALRILEEELIVAMGLMGVTRISELNSEHLRQADGVAIPHPLGSFPLVMEHLYGLGYGQR